jgi:hypothetical protein
MNWDVISKKHGSQEIGILVPSLVILEGTDRFLSKDTMREDYVNLQLQYLSYMSYFSILEYTSPVILASYEKECPII